MTQRKEKPKSPRTGEARYKLSTSKRNTFKAFAVTDKCNYTVNGRESIERTTTRP